MKYAFLGQTGLSVSRLSYGAMTFGTTTDLAPGVANSTNQKSADELIGYAIDAGINFFDTADVYGFGESEVMLGKALGPKRKDVVIATKAGFRMGPSRLNNGLSYRHLLASVEGSLKRLGTDWLDVFLLHRADPTTPYEETMRALDDLVRQGKVRYTGLCNHQSWQIERFVGISRQTGQHPMTVAQMYYSLLGRDIEQDCVEFFRDTGFGVMIWSPLAGGFLTGKYRRDLTIPDDARRKNFQMPPVDFELGYNVVTALEKIAGEKSATIAQIALAWILAKPWASTIIIGASRISQLKDNISAINIDLTAGEIAILDALTKQKARYPNLNWLPDNADLATAKVVGKTR